MTKSIRLSVLFCSVIFMAFFVSCEKECIGTGTGLEGRWQWVKSVGGFGGWTSTPGWLTTKTLIIDAHTYTEYTLDSISFQSTYTLRTDSIVGTDKIIEFETGGILGVILEQQTLELREPCCDGFCHFYERK